MRSLSIYFTLFFNLHFFANGQVTFQKIYSTIDNLSPVSIDVTSDGGFLVGGQKIAGPNDTVHFCVLKLDYLGNIIWSKEYYNSLVSLPASSMQTFDQGFVQLGRTKDSISLAHRVILIKADSNGNVEWSREYGEQFEDPAAVFVQQTSDSGYIFSSHAYESLIIRTNSQGDTLWTKNYSASMISSMLQSNDNGFVLAGRVDTLGGGANALWCKIDSMGNIIWSHVIDGGSASEEFVSLIKTLGNDYLIIGNSSEAGATDKKIFIIKTNFFGDTIWTKTFEAGTGCHASQVVQDSDSGYTIVGYVSHGVNEFVLLFKIDIAGNVVWSKEFNGESVGISLKKTSDGGNIIAANKYDIWSIYLIKTDSIGISGCNDNNASVILSNKSFQIYNALTSSSLGYQVFLPIINTANELTVSTTLCLEDDIQKISAPIFISLSPNPALSAFSIETNQSEIKSIEIFNVLGKKVEFIQFSENKKDVVIYTSRLSPGIYFVIVETENGTSVQKLVKQ